MALPFLGSLLSHIRHEEAENQRQLRALQQNAELPGYEIETSIQHSQLLSQLTQDTESDPALVASILHHFMEEHDWFRETISGLAGSPASGTRAGAPAASTVGSLLSGIGSVPR